MVPVYLSVPKMMMVISIPLALDSVVILFFGCLFYFIFPLVVVAQSIIPCVAATHSSDTSYYNRLLHDRDNPIVSFWEMFGS